ncbi:MAG: glycoside hydrolase/phage tail family protein [Asticcacaulis sp.]
MAQVVLSAVGTAIGGPVGGVIGAAIGGVLDKTLINALEPVRQLGPRLEGIRVSASAQGSPVKQVYGRGRVAASVIWAARLRESRESSRASKNGPRTESFSYSLSFAVGLCEGPIDGIGRVWADGQVLDLSQFACRLYKGGEDQMPDSLITAIEGSAPAYRGLAYMVFEDMPLGLFGNRPPNLSVEVFRRGAKTDDVENLIEGVCLIPGAGEFVYATAHNVVLRGLSKARYETQNTAEGQPDFLVALDQLEAQLPNLKRVNLVVSWFGDDLRAGHCQIKPGVEQRFKVTRPLSWTVAGIGRNTAHLIGTYEGRPVYGGTPSDQTVIAAIQALKSRGYEVTLIPFILMDIAPDNNKPDPYGGVRQAAYPWRGRITCDIAPDRAGTADKTSAIASDVAAFFGSAQASQFSVSGGRVTYSGPSTWGMRRFVLHLAALGKAAGGVSCVLLGSEMRGLTTLRSGINTYPAVTQLKLLAAEVRSLVGAGTQISYAADWSEYFGHQPSGGHVAFHLDPLWADANVDFVGIDWYAPLTDWRDGDGHLDGGAAGSIYDEAYLASRVCGGEGFDWYYASESDRAAQVRTAITDGAHGEPWIYRPKDIVNWWSRAHFDRPNGVRSGVPTAWVAKSKPIRFIEYGCGAIDKGPNAPNLFLDPKSSESFVPPFSTGERDDRAQKVYLKALVNHYRAPDNNPLSATYGGRMLQGMDVWCWDARPYPYFPLKSDVWGDGGNWRTGHWLNGRMGSGEAKNLLGYLAAQVGITDFDVSAVSGLIDGYVIEQPMSAAQALEPVLDYLGLTIAERGDGLVVVGQPEQVSELTAADMACDGASPVLARRDLVAVPSGLTLRCYDLDRDYQLQAVYVRHDGASGGETLSVDIGLCLSAAQARDYARYSLNRVRGLRESLSVDVAPSAVLRCEAGDVVRLEGGEALYRVSGVDRDERPAMQLTPVTDRRVPVSAEPVTGGSNGMVRSVVTGFTLLELPCFGGESDVRPVLAVTADPFAGVDVYGGAGEADLRLRGRVEQPASVGRTLMALMPAQAGVWLRRAFLDIYLEGSAPVSRSETEVLGGQNIICVKAQNGEWERIGFLHSEALGGDQYRLSGLLRGQDGTLGAMRAGIGADAEVIILPSVPVRADLATTEIGLTRLWRAGQAGFGGAAAEAIETEAVWTGLALRPRAPVHARIRGRFGQDMRISWQRCARYGGDSLEVEPPLDEAAEIFRLRIYDGAIMRREIEVNGREWVYGISGQAADYVSGFNAHSRLEIAQKSTTSQYGLALEVALMA